MTGVLLSLTGVSAIVDWVAVQRDNKPLEYVSKPLTLALLVVVALVEWDGAGRAAPWLVAALVFSLAGDVFLMLPGNLFVPGLASFLVAHICYVAVFDPGVPEQAWEWAAVVVVLAVGAMLFGRLLKGLRSKELGELVAPVAAYSVAISLMVFSAVTFSAIAAAGAILFFISDSLIGWTRFVQDVPHGKVAIHVTYHLGQILLVSSLVL